VRAIVAIIKAHKLDDVAEALRDLGVNFRTNERGRDAI